MTAASPSDRTAGIDLAATARAILDAVPCRAILQDRPLETARPEESLFVAVNRLWWRRVGALPVLDDGELIGCFAEEDLLRVLAARLEASQGSEAAAEVSVWSPELLGDLRVADAMTARKELPVVEAEAPLGVGLSLCCGADVPQGRYLFVVERTESGIRLRLASFRDVARYLTALYAGAAVPEHFASPEAGVRAQEAALTVLGLSTGEVRQRWRLGHEPNEVALAESAAGVIATMASRRRGYVLVAQEDRSPFGICTRRDVLRVCAPRFARLGGLRLSSWMSPRVRTLTETDTLFGLFRLMALESCRHMPLVDAWDRVLAVVSMFEGVALLAGQVGSHRD